MTRIEPDGWIAAGMGDVIDDDPAFLRSTVLRAIDEEIAELVADITENGCEEDLYEVDPLRRLRARFQPNEGENGHE